MISPKNKIEELLQKDQLTAEETRLLFDYFENSGSARLMELMKKFFLSDVENPVVLNSAISERLLDRINEKIRINQKKERAKLKRIWTFRAAAAACIAGLVCLSIYSLVNNNKQQKDPAKASIRKYKNDVTPGGDKAVLTLADGTTIVLDSAQNGTITQQGSAKVIKIDGKLNYSISGSGKNEVLYNTISTPRGGQYQVELPDGSQVWLNAASSLHFPTAFTGKERKVEITGEVYFEVASNKAMPFIVSANGAEIQVLGTHFNVMAYQDEATLKTTLLKGSVKFVSHGNSAMLKPGQQSQLSGDGQIKVVSDVDLKDVMAWKNGFFHFEALDFETVAKQLSRWYDVEVVCNRKVDDLLYAEIPRDTRLSDVLKALELTGKLRFEISGKNIVVIP